ncbi:hypothetical protein ACFWPH_22575 [Nocardia sp. NPDC058499]|uniref:hypothetical protein n=1 Tax=Nocardia sp. NPDC058499 TaxID=3346530 RepID=UPI00364AF37F
MIPINITPDLMPAISAGFAAQEAEMIGTVHSATPRAMPGPTGFHMPGFLMSVGFSAVGAVVSSLVDVASVEKLDGVAKIVPAAGVLQATDVAGSVPVAAVGGAVATSVLGN